MMLGATLEELQVLSGRLDSTTAEIGDVGGETQRVAATVVTDAQTAFATAVNGITASMGTLRSTVDASRSTLDATTWTGANRVTFDGAYADFGGAMTQLEAAIADAYSEFDAQMRQMTEVIETFQAQVATNLDQAQTSTTSMARAVDAQRENLDLAMNSGIGVG